jgi:hypothetical protein
VSRFVEGRATNLPTKNETEQEIGSKAEYVRTAIQKVVEEGFMVVDETPRGHYLKSVRPFREADEWQE